MTPKQFKALWKRHEYHVTSNEYLFGQLTSWVANSGFRTTKEPTTPQDFMPSQRHKIAAAQEKARKPIRMTKKRRQRIAQAIDATLGIIAKRVLQCQTE